jgi:hypothetical protein
MNYLSSHLKFSQPYSFIQYDPGVDSIETMVLPSNISSSM